MKREAVRHSRDSKGAFTLREPDFEVLFFDPGVTEQDLREGKRFRRSERPKSKLPRLDPVFF
ncbi:MAG: hypothetical protein ACE5JX_12520 [Acidobacteriota bacterium]